jgi:hypothetical protein
MFCYFSDKVLFLVRYGLSHHTPSSLLCVSSLIDVTTEMYSFSCSQILSTEFI